MRLCWWWLSVCARCVLGTVQGLLVSQLCPPFPAGETEALSCKGHSSRSHSGGDADANPEVPDSRQLSQQHGALQGLRTIQCPIGSM